MTKKRKEESKRERKITNNSRQKTLPKDARLQTNIFDNHTQQNNTTIS